MNPDIKSKWIQALRSGNYKQAKGSLRVDDGFCCLGVLCDVYQKEVGDANWENCAFMEQKQILPKKVYEWAGLHSVSPYVSLDADRGISLASMNDVGDDFAKIADVIERDL